MTDLMTASRPTTSPGRSAAVRRRLALTGDLFGTIAIAIMVFPVVLWIRGGGLTGWGADGGALTSIGRLTGLVASALLLLQVLLMARVPWVETVWGQDTLARRHRWVGFTSFNLMLVHIVAITIGYAQAAGVNLLAQAWDLVIDYPGMLLATAGTLALVLVVVTSMRAARRRLRYESWHLLHLYAYVGVGLALPHQLWTGADFTASPTATVFWWGLWGAAAVAIIGCRLVLPLVVSLRHDLRVHSVGWEGPGVVSVVLSGRNLDRWGLRPGQFCHWRFLGGPGWTRSHPYSISAAPRPDRLRITVKALGDGSAELRTLTAGRRVLVEGPYGVMTADRRSRRDVLMICAGVGITPLRALAEAIALEAPSADHDGVRPPAVTVLHRISHPDHRLFDAEFAEFAPFGVRLIPMAGPRGTQSSFFPGPGPVDAVAALRQLVPQVAQCEVYLCGPAEFMAAARTAVLAAGVPRASIHAERFGW